MISIFGGLCPLFPLFTFSALFESWQEQRMPDTAAPALAVLENPHQHLCKDLENDGVYVIDIKLPHRSLISGVSISACSTLRVLCVEGSDCETPEEEVTAQPPRSLTN